jgi:hypothetical protein
MSAAPARARRTPVAMIERINRENVLMNVVDEIRCRWKGCFGIVEFYCKVVTDRNTGDLRFGEEYCRAHAEEFARATGAKLPEQKDGSQP